MLTFNRKKLVIIVICLIIYFAFKIWDVAYPEDADEDEGPEEITQDLIHFIVITTG